jgi:hypothetical protein
MHSTAGEAGFPGLATYDFLHATYRSAVITFQGREVADHNGASLQALTPAQSAAVNSYDPQGSIPLVLIGGQYGQTSSGYSPSVIAGLSFARIHTLVYHDPASAIGRHVVKEANTITTLVCATLGGRAQTVAACRLPAVRAALQATPQAALPGG